MSIALGLLGLILIVLILRLLWPFLEPFVLLLGPVVLFFLAAYVVILLVKGAGSLAKRIVEYENIILPIFILCVVLAIAIAYFVHLARKLRSNRESSRVGEAMRIAKSLPSLLSENPELADGLYERGMGDRSIDVRLATVNSLPALLSTNSNLAVSLYMWAFRYPGLVRKEAFKTLKLWAMQPIRRVIAALTLWGPKRDLLSCLGYSYYDSQNPFDPREEDIVLEKMERDFLELSNKVVVPPIDSVNPDVVSALYEGAFKSSDRETREEAVKWLPALVDVNPELAATIYAQALQLAPDDVFCHERRIAELWSRHFPRLVPMIQALDSEYRRKGGRRLDGQERQVRCHGMPPQSPDSGYGPFDFGNETAQRERRRAQDSVRIQRR